MNVMASTEAEVRPPEALAVVEPSALVLPAVNAVAMKAAMKAYTELCEAVLVPSDYQQISGKTFKKRSAWQKLATAFSVSTEIVSRTVHTDEDGRVIRAEFTIRATAPNGRHEDGYGAASLRERTFTKPDHDIPATAETRARNRACANLFAFGELTAEEMSDDGASGGSKLEAPVRPTTTTTKTPQATAAPSSPPRPVGKNLVPLKRTQVAEEAPPREQDSLAAVRQEIVERAVALELLERQRDGLEPLPEDVALIRARKRCDQFLGLYSGTTVDVATESQLEAVSRKIGRDLAKVEATT